MTCLDRNITAKTVQLLDMFPGVIILGVRQSGKTFLSKKIRPEWHYADLENEDDFDRISTDTGFFFKEHPSGLILDEAQEYPPLFKTLRGLIDKARQQKNRFIITGSSSPELLQTVSESLAGRVAVVELGTLKMNEIVEAPLSRFYDIFNKSLSVTDLKYLKTLHPVVTHAQFKEVFLRGGYPEPVLSKDREFHSHWMANYFKTYIDRDIRNQFPGLNRIKYRRFIRMLARLSGQMVNKAELARSLNIAESTARDYLDIAHETYVWRNYFSFERDSHKSVVKMPRGGFRDIGLLNSLLKIPSIEMLYAWPQVGRLFENFICEEIIKGLGATMEANWDYHYYRTRNGAEIDLILEGEFGLLPIEIKLGMKTNQRKLASLKRFMERHQLPYGLLINNADTIELIAENILQIPATYI